MLNGLITLIRRALQQHKRRAAARQRRAAIKNDPSIPF